MNQSILNAKKETVKHIAASIKESQTVAIVSYQGLSVAEMEELRKTLKKTSTTFGVYKNTLISLALKEVGDADLSEILNGPSAVVFSKELSAGAKDLVKFSRFHDKLVIKGGLIDGKAATKEDIVEISKLPGKDGLLSMLLSCFQAPIRNFAYAIDQVAQKSAGNAAN